MGKIKNRLLAVRFDIAIMRHMPRFRREVRAEKDRCIDRQIAYYKRHGGWSAIIAAEHAVNMQVIYRANGLLIAKTAAKYAPDLIDGLKAAMAQHEYKANANDIGEQALRKWFATTAGERAKQTAQTTMGDVRRLLSQAFDEGEPEAQVLKAGLAAKGLSAWRADVIARTETHAAAQFVSDFVARQIASEVGVQLEKAWVPVFDDRTREAHAGMDSEDWIHMDAAFLVGGERLQYPGDPAGSAENTVNCRCQLVKRVKD
jgi:hypothetical protein